MNSSSESKFKYQAFVFAFCSALCFVLSFYPFGWGWFGWLAPIGVLLLCLQKQLPGRRPWWQIWIACFLCWLVLFQCVRLPHWAGYIGWPILSGYLCTYLFLFVVVSRQLIHGWHFPALIAPPICWAGLEYMQAHFCSGISLGMLSHTQAAYPLLVQVADIGGCYTVTFFMVAIATGLVVGALSLLPLHGSAEVGEKRGNTNTSSSNWCLTPSRVRACLAFGQTAICIGFVVIYGKFRIEDADQKLDSHPKRIALVQGSIDTRFPSEGEMQEYLNSFTEHYTKLSVEACQQDIDLALWPESMFPMTDVYAGTSDLSEAERQRIRDYEFAISVTAHVVTGAGVVRTTETGQAFKKTKEATPILAGASSAPLGGELAFFNSAILISKDGEVVSRYGKMNLVLFGEFVPLGDVFPWLYNFFPIPPGLRAGDSPTAMENGGFVYSPSICFESTYPHLIRSHCLKLGEMGKKPDVLVNLTNDGWFYGSTALDLHFANNVLRAIENRTPMLIAANTGFSGQIDSAGRVLSKGPRRKPAVLIVNLVTSRQVSTYHRIGDWPAFLCLIVVLAGFFGLIYTRFFTRKLQLNKHLNADENPESEPER